MSKGIQKSSFGRLPDGTEIDLYTLTNANGLTCKIMNYGATIVEIQTPDRNGKFANIILGYDTLEEYVNGKDYRGAVIGRVANRIRGASFELAGKTYKLAANDGPNHLHGGVRGFDKRVWRVVEHPPFEGLALALHYTSSDNEEGYPGDLQVKVMIGLNDENMLLFDYHASTSKPTPVNLTHHPYWNLTGEGNILDHDLMIAADRYTPLDGQHLPKGVIEAVNGTPFDFKSPARIGSRLHLLPCDPPGYNTNYVFSEKLHHPHLAALAAESKTGRMLELRTDQPGLQFYSGTYLPVPFSGFCLETQGFPDAVHHNNFPSIILKAGDVYRHRTMCRFATA